MQLNTEDVIVGQTIATSKMWAGTARSLVVWQLQSKAQNTVPHYKLYRVCCDLHLK